MPKNLILVLGDQLSPRISSLARGNPETDTVLIAEVQAQATYVRRHKKKIALIFSAMRHFASELRTRGWRVTTGGSMRPAAMAVSQRKWRARLPRSIRTA